MRAFNLRRPLVGLVVFERRFPGGPSEKLAGLRRWRDDVLSALPRIGEKSNAERERQRTQEFAAEREFALVEEYFRSHPADVEGSLRMLEAMASRYP